MLFDKLAQSVMELPGVEGLCLVETESASLLYNRMPAFIPEFAFETALRRITALYETVDSGFQPVDDFVLRFRGNSLVLRRAGGMVLILFLAESAHLVSLRIVTNIVLKNAQANPAILAELRNARPVLVATVNTPADAAAHAQRTPAPETPAAGREPEAAPGTAVKSRKSLRVYRGVVIGSE